MHFGGTLNESYVSDSDSQSVMSQSVLILPSSYSFDQVQLMHAKLLILCYCKIM